jgi:hypothetical protein
MANLYTEDELIVKPAIAVFRELGWQHVTSDGIDPPWT